MSETTEPLNIPKVDRPAPPLVPEEDGDGQQ